MLRLLLWLFSVFAAVCAVIVLWNEGLSRPKALFGATIWAVGFGLMGIRESRRAKMKRSPKFAAELSFVESAAPKGAIISEATRTLEQRFHHAGNQRGFTFTHGFVDLVSFVGSTMVFDLLAKHEKVIGKRIFAAVQKIGEPDGRPNAAEPPCEFGRQ